MFGVGSAAELPRRRILSGVLGGTLGAFGLVPADDGWVARSPKCEGPCDRCERCMDGECVRRRNFALCRERVRDRRDDRDNRSPSPLLECPVFPANNIWNTRIDGLPVHPRSDAYINAIGAAKPLGPDFSIPYAVVSGDQRRVTVRFGWSRGPASDAYPIPRDAPIEAAVDRHVVVVDARDCTLYELFAARRDGRKWRAYSGAHWDLTSNALRPDGQTSADAAGLPMLPGLLRYDEVAQGFVGHALRFTAPGTRAAHVWPARHHASPSDDPDLPPMGQRFRLRADFDASGFSPRVQVILAALKQFGLMLADNGGAWIFQGAPDKRWHDGDPDIHDLRLRVRGSDFEAVDATVLMRDPDSATAG